MRTDPASAVRLFLAVLALAVFWCGCGDRRTHDRGNDAPMVVKVVVVTMFEIGKDEGDRAGEFQLWKQRQNLSTRFDMPGAYHDVFMNRDRGVMGMVTGVGTASAAASVMAVGLDPRFDLSHAYWLINGIAGFDPEDASVGSAAWAEYLVDGDLAYEIDSREIPPDWATG